MKIDFVVNDEKKALEKILFQNDDNEIKKLKFSSMNCSSKTIFFDW